MGYWLGIWRKGLEPLDILQVIIAVTTLSLLSEIRMTNDAIERTVKFANDPIMADSSRTRRDVASAKALEEVDLPYRVGREQLITHNGDMARFMRNCIAGQGEDEQAVSKTVEYTTNAGSKMNVTVHDRKSDKDFDSIFQLDLSWRELATTSMTLSENPYQAPIYCMVHPDNVTHYTGRSTEWSSNQYSTVGEGSLDGRLPSLEHPDAMNRLQHNYDMCRTYKVNSANHIDYNLSDANLGGPVPAGSALPAHQQVCHVDSVVVRAGTDGRDAFLIKRTFVQVHLSREQHVMWHNDPLYSEAAEADTEPSSDIVDTYKDKKKLEDDDVKRANMCGNHPARCHDVTPTCMEAYLMHYGDTEADVNECQPLNTSGYKSINQNCCEPGTETDLYGLNAFFNHPGADTFPMCVVRRHVNASGVQCDANAAARYLLYFACGAARYHKTKTGSLPGAELAHGDHPHPSLGDNIAGRQDSYDPAHIPSPWLSSMLPQRGARHSMRSDCPLLADAVKYYNDMVGLSDIERFISEARAAHPDLSQQGASSFHRYVLDDTDPSGYSDCTQGTPGCVFNLAGDVVMDPISGKARFVHMDGTVHRALDPMYNVSVQADYAYDVLHTVEGIVMLAGALGYPNSRGTYHSMHLTDKNIGHDLENGDYNPITLSPLFIKDPLGSIRNDVNNGRNDPFSSGVDLHYGCGAQYATTLCSGTNPIMTNNASGIVGPRYGNPDGSNGNDLYGYGSLAIAGGLVTGAGGTAEILSLSHFGRVQYGEMMAYTSHQPTERVDWQVTAFPPGTTIPAGYVVPHNPVLGIGRFSPQYSIEPQTHDDLLKAMTLYLQCMYRGNHTDMSQWGVVGTDYDVTSVTHSRVCKKFADGSGLATPDASAKSAVFYMEAHPDGRCADCKHLSKERRSAIMSAEDRPRNITGQPVESLAELLTIENQCRMSGMHSTINGMYMANNQSIYSATSKASAGRAGPEPHCINFVGGQPTRDEQCRYDTSNNFQGLQTTCVEFFVVTSSISRHVMLALLILVVYRAAMWVADLVRNLPGVFSSCATGIDAEGAKRNRYVSYTGLTHGHMPWVEKRPGVGDVPSGGTEGRHNGTLGEDSTSPSEYWSTPATRIWGFVMVLGACAVHVTVVVLLSMALVEIEPVSSDTYVQARVTTFLQNAGDTYVRHALSAIVGDDTTEHRLSEDQASVTDHGGLAMFTFVYVAAVTHALVSSLLALRLFWRMLQFYPTDDGSPYYGSDPDNTPGKKGYLWWSYDDSNSRSIWQKVMGKMNTSEAFVY